MRVSRIPEDAMSDGASAGACSFCGKRQAEVARLLSGRSGVRICDECLALCRDIVAEDVYQPSEVVESTAEWTPSEEELEELERIGKELGEGEGGLVQLVDGKLDVSKRSRVATRAGAPRTCSFCGKDEDAVAKLIAGQTVYICDECIRRLSPSS
jgi:ClpX C4-type zinc finger